MTPKRGARWADTGGRSKGVLVRDEEVRRSLVYSAKARRAILSLGEGGNVDKQKDRSQMPSRARPCATLARLPTVHITAASRASSRSGS